MPFRKGNRLWDNPKVRATQFKKGVSASPATQFKSGTASWNKGMIGWNAGEANPAWKGGIEFRAPSEKKHLCSKYMGWMTQVKDRDGWKCKIANEDCEGRLEAHHILRWQDHPELRYDLNNGITLCHAHHPRRRAEEKRLAPLFRELVSVSSI